MTLLTVKDTCRRRDHRRGKFYSAKTLNWGRGLASARIFFVSRQSPFIQDSHSQRTAFDLIGNL